MFDISKYTKKTSHRQTTGNGSPAWGLGQELTTPNQRMTP
jgi:hypothetical protein